MPPPADTFVETDNPLYSGPTPAPEDPDDPTSEKTPIELTLERSRTLMAMLESFEARLKQADGVPSPRDSGLPPLAKRGSFSFRAGASPKPADSVSKEEILTMLQTMKAFMKLFEEGMKATNTNITAMYDEMDRRVETVATEVRRSVSFKSRPPPTPAAKVRDTRFGAPANTIQTRDSSESNNSGVVFESDDEDDPL